MALRKIVRIDEEKCNGCGLCVPSCAEGAIQIIDGKARLLDDQYCDGLGACLGDCPLDAIIIEEREAVEFDPDAVEVHLAELGEDPVPETEASTQKPAAAASGCPGAAVKSFKPPETGTPSAPSGEGPAIQSRLTNWPVQLKLVSPSAPYLQGARLLIAADCVPFAFAEFHRETLAGKILLIGCPKLDDGELYKDKLTDIFTMNNIKSIELPYMEVPCCYGLVQIVRFALKASGRDIPLTLTRVGIRGDIIEKVVDEKDAPV